MGRPRQFEPDEVLDKAMMLFWRQGFEKTSMQELVEQTGIHKRSMYDTFGDKHNLFLMALGRYADLAERNQLQAATRDDNARQMIRELLESSVVGARDGAAAGCMLVNSATEVAVYNNEAATRIRDNFARSEKVIAQIVRRGQEKSEITVKYDAASLSSIIFNAWVGIRVQARNGTPATKLQKMVDNVMMLLD
jgi:TetR/AcrR family transcriptional repressor of nem operon